MQTSQPTSLTEAIRSVIIKRGLSAYAVAKMSGVSPVVIQRFVSGERGLSLESADKIAMNLRLCIREMKDESEDSGIYSSNEGAISKDAGGERSGPQRYTQLIFSRKIGDAIVINDGALIVSIDDITNNVVTWNVKKAGARKAKLYNSTSGETVDLGDGITFTATNVGKTSLRLIVTAPYNVRIARFEIFKSTQIPR